MVGPVLLALVFLSFACLCYVLSLVWQYQENELYFIFHWFSIIAGVCGGCILILTIVGILRDQ